MLIINAALVRQLLPMRHCIEVMAPAMLAASTGSVSIPARTFHALPDASGWLGLMPGFAQELETYGSKVISLHAGNTGRGLPAIQGFVALFDYANGVPLAIVEGAQVTAIRTAAASGLATRLLARDDAASCGIFGTGVQAATHIDAICAVRDIEKVLVWGRDFVKTETFALTQSQRTGLRVQATIDPAEAAACDILCTVTGSNEPVLEGRWVQPGTHVNLVGAHSLNAREADSALVVKAAVYVDLLTSARNESGDIMIPISEGVMGEEHIVGEVGQLLAGTAAGRTSRDQITLYNSLGITAQDLFAARAVYDQAVALGLGAHVEF